MVEPKRRFQGDGSRVDTFFMRGNKRADKFASRFGATSFGRSPETWRRRDSFLLGGLLGFVGYLLAAIAVIVNLSTFGHFGIALLAALIVLLAVAEASYGLRPSQARLARADRLALVTVGTVLSISTVCGLVLLAQEAFG
jgi:hypothetical protein